MLKFKSPEVEAEFWSEKTEHYTRYVALCLTEFAHQEFKKDLIVTDVSRAATGQPSAHPLGRAFDFRANKGYWTDIETEALSGFLQSKFGRTDGKKVIIFHGEETGDPDNYHGHCQVQAGVKVYLQIPAGGSV